VFTSQMALLEFYRCSSLLPLQYSAFRIHREADTISW